MVRRCMATRLGLGWIALDASEYAVSTVVPYAGPSPHGDTTAQTVAPLVTVSAPHGGAGP
jgi:hypothetical protein